MPGADTEARLRDWRSGQAKAEGLVAGLLHLDGFKDVDPQHPLGGPDGLKDVLCREKGALWVAAAFFPPTAVTFTAIRRKFDHDVLGVAANGATGFAFFVNQRVSQTDRKKLKESSPAPRNEIYHLERMVNLLNTARGYGLRLEYLGIPMAPEEQWSSWSEMNTDLAVRFAASEARGRGRFKEVFGALERLDARTRMISEDLAALPSTIASRPRLQGGDEPPTSTLTPAQTCWLHRIITEGSGLQDTQRGRFRGTDDVWIGTSDRPDAKGNVVPVAAAQIRDELTRLLDWWRHRHAELRGRHAPEIVQALAEFHHRFFLIHPFIDGNGRVARLILDQAARELLHRGVRPTLTSPPKEYFAALERADAGDLVPLRERILGSLE